MFQNAKETFNQFFSCSANHLRENGNKKKVFNQILKILACSVVVIFFFKIRLRRRCECLYTHIHISCNDGIIMSQFKELFYTFSVMYIVIVDIKEGQSESNKIRKKSVKN